jgi:hypothetical protein
MRAGHFYRHPKCLDVDIRVSEILSVEPDRMEVRVCYWNHFYEMYQGEMEDVTIKMGDLDVWQEVIHE